MSISDLKHGNLIVSKMISELKLVSRLRFFLVFLRLLNIENVAMHVAIGILSHLEEKKFCPSESHFETTVILLTPKWSCLSVAETSGVSKYDSVRQDFSSSVENDVAW